MNKKNISSRKYLKTFLKYYLPFKLTSIKIKILAPDLHPFSNILKLDDLLPRKGSK